MSDAPIRLASEDCYGRSANATTLAGSIRHLRTDESFVIGFSGEWGSGKTSFINMVCESLRNPEHGEAATTVVTFNPWLIEDRKALLGSFFAALAAALPKQDNGQRRKRDGRISLYQPRNLRRGYALFYPSEARKVNRKSKLNILSLTPPPPPGRCSPARARRNPWAGGRRRWPRGACRSRGRCRARFRRDGG